MTVRTMNNQVDKPKYDCYNNNDCTKSVTWDDWHCTGCRWKGLGVSEREWAPSVKEEYNRVKAALFFERVITGR